MPELRITGGSLKSRKINFLEQETLRPTLSKTREAIFNVLANYIDFEVSSFLDTFSGSGIMAFEAYSRGFNEVFCIDSNYKTYTQIKKNINTLSVNITPVCGTVPAIFDKAPFLEKKFTVIFLDPPYKSNLYIPSIERIDSKGLLQDDGILITESVQNQDIKFVNFKILQQKVYSDKLITFLKKI